jgi:TolB protein
MTRVLVLVGAISLVVAGSAGSQPGRTGLIAYTSGCNLSVMNADGTNVRELTHACQDADPSWSPDGSQIAFSTSRNQGVPEIWLMNADGSGAQRVTPIGVAGIQPAWSKPGAIAFTDLTTGGIDTIDPDGTNLKELTDFGADPSWSPTGRTIAFDAHNTGEQRNDVYLMNADGTDVRELAAGWTPAFSPDGTSLAYTTMDSSGNVFLTVANADGSDPQQILAETLPDATYLAENAMPAWSPDSQWIAFTSASPAEIWVVPATGGIPIKLTTTGTVNLDPDWQPEVSSSGLVIAKVKFGAHACATRPGRATVTVTDAQSRPLAGATVWIGGTRATTGSLGRAVVKVTPAKDRHIRVILKVLAALPGRVAAQTFVTLPFCA